MCSRQHHITRKCTEAAGNTRNNDDPGNGKGVQEHLQDSKFYISTKRCTSCTSSLTAALRCSLQCSSVPTYAQKIHETLAWEIPEHESTGTGPFRKRAPIVNPRKLEHRFRMIHAGIPYTLL